MAGRHGKHAEGTATPTISMDEALWKAARDKAASEGVAASAVIRDLLRRWIAGEITFTDDAQS